MPTWQEVLCSVVTLLGIVAVFVLLIGTGPT